ncbi:hypothetical protein [Phytomonospora endophytica]|uniref:Uncharacterized protein n=1 Tax=Phytomonospora endophytica TaxID=714109 RepID=A0A841FF16_9ACTN|nr:hypothetical protein [Phytomonospora endophytica]MBB6034434.1 hypothetical protein [Phytomonospora endophytica]GIG66828.1 hypothetical protein Pen01_31230 [Phytomonospora endophytica]
MTTEPKQRFAGAALPWITGIAGAAAVMVIWFGVTVYDAGRPPGEIVAPEPTVIAESDAPPAEPELMLHPGTRCAWPRLGAPWQDYPTAEEWQRRELHNTVGQMIAIDDEWIAPFVGGQLNEDVVAYKGPGKLRATADAVQKYSLETYYNDDDGSDMDGLKTGKGVYRPFDVDGRGGLIAEYRVTWKKAMAGDKGEVQIVAVVDIDGERAMVFHLALPDSQSDQYLPVMDALLDARFLE